MPPENEKPAEGEDTSEDLDARITRLLDAKLNSALTSRDKRLQAAISKSLEEQLAKFTPTAPAAEPKGDAPATGAAPKADPEVLKLRDQVERLQRQAEEATRARADAEQRARRDGARAQLREALEAKGVKGARARAVIADLEAQGAVRFDEETGAASLVLKRVRTKGASAQELAFDDLAAGIDDWSKSPDAAEFLPAPQTATTPRRPGAPQTATTQRTGPARPQTDDEIAEAVAQDLERQGVDVASLFD